MADQIINQQVVEPPRPPDLVAFEDEQARREAEFEATWGCKPFDAAAPEEAVVAYGEAKTKAFAQVFLKLTPAEHEAERSRRQRKGESLGLAYLLVEEWDVSVAAACSQISYNLTVLGNARSRAEMQAITGAEGVLKHCSYLGGFGAYPRPASNCAMMRHIATGGNLHWRNVRGETVCATTWPEVVAITVTATDRSQDRITATRVAAVGIFALGAKKPRREAKLSVKTRSGEGIFIVKGRTPSELQAQLAPLAACIGQPTSEDYQAAVRAADALRPALRS